MPGRALAYDSVPKIVRPRNAQDSVQPTISPGTVAGTGATFGYTGDGLRGWKQNSGGAKTYYLYDGTDSVAEMDSSGNILAVNTFGAEGLISRHTTASNSTVNYTFDERGNVAQRLTSTGAVISTDLYDAFGARTSTAAQTDPWGYGAQSGYYTDVETGLILCTHRFYDPSTGRWLTRDPMGYGGGVNLYGYVGNNPVNEIDSEGLSFKLDNDKFRRYRGLKEHGRHIHRDCDKKRFNRDGEEVDNNDQPVKNGDRIPSRLRDKFRRGFDNEFPPDETDDVPEVTPFTRWLANRSDADLVAISVLGGAVVVGSYYIAPVVAPIVVRSAPVLAPLLAR